MLVEGWEKKDFDGCGDNSQGWLIEYACMDEWSLGSFFFIWFGNVEGQLM